MALVLGFDTSAAHCAAALVRGDRILAERFEPMTRGQAERLFPLLEELLKDAGADWAAIERIGVGIGPGNFTGTRIAVSAARGLAMSLGIPAIGVSGFEALALDLPRPVLACIDGRAGRSYLQLFRITGADAAVTWTGDPGDLPALPEGCRVVGHDAERIAALAATTATATTTAGTATAGTATAPAVATAPAIALIARDARPGARPPAPLYMRAADAAPSRHRAPVILA